MTRLACTYFMAGSHERCPGAGALEVDVRRGGAIYPEVVVAVVADAGRRHAYPVGQVGDDVPGEGAAGRGGQRGEGGVGGGVQGGAVLVIELEDVVVGRRGRQVGPIQQMLDADDRAAVGAGVGGVRARGGADHQPGAHRRVGGTGDGDAVDLRRDHQIGDCGHGDRLVQWTWWNFRTGSASEFMGDSKQGWVRVVNVSGGPVPCTRPSMARSGFAERWCAFIVSFTRWTLARLAPSTSGTAARRGTPRATRPTNAARPSRICI